MSNSPFFHQDKALERGMEVVLAVVIKKGKRCGKPNPQLFASGIRLEIQKSILPEFGRTGEQQTETIAGCIELLCDRGLLGYDRRKKTLYSTRRGWRARKATLTDRNRRKNKRPSCKRRQGTTAAVA